MKKAKKHWYFYVPYFYSGYNDYRLVLSILRYLFVPIIKVNRKLKYYRPDNLSIPVINRMPEVKIEYMFFGFYFWKGSEQYWQRYVWKQRGGLVYKEIWEACFEIKWDDYEG